MQDNNSIAWRYLMALNGQATTPATERATPTPRAKKAAKPESGKTQERLLKRQEKAVKTILGHWKGERKNLFYAKAIIDGDNAIVTDSAIAVSIPFDSAVPHDYPTTDSEDLPDSSYSNLHAIFQEPRYPSLGKKQLTAGELRKLAQNAKENIKGKKNAPIDNFPTLEGSDDYKPDSRLVLLALDALSVDDGDAIIVARNKYGTMVSLTAGGKKAVVCCIRMRGTH